MARPWCSEHPPATSRHVAESVISPSSSASRPGSRGPRCSPSIAGSCSCRRTRHHEFVRQAIEVVGLAERANDKVANFSKGMQQRLGLAVALLGDPELVVLDEPTSALDPVGRHDVREIIRSIKARGATVFLNTHLLGEAEQVCDRVCVIDHGRSVATGSLSEMLDSRTSLRLKVGGLPGAWWTTFSSFGPLDQRRRMAPARLRPPRHGARRGRRHRGSRRPDRGGRPRAPEPRRAVPRALGRPGPRQWPRHAGGRLRCHRRTKSWSWPASTVREALRRRLVAAFAGISIVLVSAQRMGIRPAQPQFGPHIRRSPACRSPSR